MKIIDTHFHLWDLEKVELAWLNKSYPEINRNFLMSDYLDFLTNNSDINVEQSVYIEGDFAIDYKEIENKSILDTIRQKDSVVTGAIVSANLLDRDFAENFKHFSDNEVKGVRHVLHTESSPQGICLDPTFKKNIKILGENNLIFEACLRTAELGDLVLLASEQSETKFVLNHVGNIDCALFNRELTNAEAELLSNWKDRMKVLGSLENVYCKLSGLSPISTKELSAVIDFILSCFSDKRLVFGTNFPVCLLSPRGKMWIDDVFYILSSKDKLIQENILYHNALRLYDL